MAMTQFHISTQTLIVHFNHLTFDIDRMFNSVVCSCETSQGTIQSMTYHLRQRTWESSDIIETKSKYFRNSLSCVMFAISKWMKIKCSKTGKIHITGCQSLEQCNTIIDLLWKYHLRFYYISSSPDPVEFICIPVMTNINFNIGYKIHCHNLNTWFNQHTPIRSLYELILGYTGVNLKFPITDSDELNFPLISYRINPDTHESIPHTTRYYREASNAILVKKKVPRTTTVLVFYSGNIIISSVYLPHIQQCYTYFTGLMKECRDKVEYIEQSSLQAT